MSVGPRSFAFLTVASLVMVTTVARRAGADIIMSAAGLNATLKKMESLKAQVDSGTKAPPQKDLYNLNDLGTLRSCSVRKDSGNDWQPCCHI